MENSIRVLTGKKCHAQYSITEDKLNEWTIYRDVYRIEGRRGNGKDQRTSNSGKP